MTEPTLTPDSCRPSPPVGVRIALLFVVAIGATFALIEPGLAPWINDEPRLVNNALYFNAAGVPATTGLLATRSDRTAAAERSLNSDAVSPTPLPANQ